MKKQQGFTLIEILMVITLLAIIASIAISSYSHHIRRAEANEAQQYMQQVAVFLDRHKARNFSYKGFDITNAIPQAGSNTVSKTTNGGTIILRSTNKYPYKINLSVSSDGRDWTMIAITTNQTNYDFLLTSAGVRCKTKTKSQISTTSKQCTTKDAEEW